MSSGQPNIDDDEEWDSDEADPTWDAVDSNQQRLWKLEATYADINEFIPFPQYVRTNDTYVQLKKADVQGNSLRNVRTHEPLGAVYISSTCFAELKNGSFDFHSGVPIRTRDGPPTFAQAVKTTTRSGDPEEITSSLPWGTLFEKGVKATTSYVPIRFVNPNIEIHIRPTGPMVTAAELQTIVNAIKGTTKQTVTVSSDIPSSLTNKGLIALDEDPFNYYQTWIKKSDLKDYLLTRKEREMASQAVSDELAKDFHNFTGVPPRAKKKQKVDFKVPSDALGLTVNLNNLKQFKAVGAKRFKTQGSVMGGSATKIADEFKWRPKEGRVSGFTTTSGVKWDVGYTPAEWLHKSAFSWGGLLDKGTQIWDSSQVPKNLVFGSSETNSVMVRTEKAWQTLFDIQATFSGGLQPNITLTQMTKQRQNIRGTLTVRATSAANLKNYETWDAGGLLLRRKTPIGAALAQQTQWLWYSFDYHLNLDFKSHSGNATTLLLGADRLLKTKFYPFQRLFYLSVQSRIDRAILSLLRVKAAKKHTQQPSKGVIHFADPKSAFISRPIPLRPAVLEFNPEAAQQGRGDDVFNTNALMTALLASSDEPPVTADNSTGRTFVASTAPRNMSLASLWESALRQSIVHVEGLEVSNPCFATIDNDGHLAEISAASVSSSEPGIQVTRIPESSALRNLSARPIELDAIPFALAHGLPDGTRFDNHILQENPVQVAPPGYVLTGDIQLFGILPAKLYSFQGTASDGGVREIVTLADELPLAKLFPGFTDTDFDSIRFRNVQLRYSDRPADDTSSPGTWLEADLVFQDALQPIADVLQSVFSQANPRMHVEFLIGMDRNWSTLEMSSNFTIRGSLPGISVKFADVVEFTTIGVEIHVNKEYDPAPYREYFSLNFGFFGEALVTVPGSIVPLHMDFTMSVDDGTIQLSMVLRDIAWENAFGIDGLTLSSIDLSASFTVRPPPRTIDFEVEAMLLSENDLIGFRGYYSQGDWGLDATVYDLSLDGFLNCFWSFFGGQVDEFSDDIEFSTVVFSIDPTGITMEGTLSVNGHQAAEASIGIDREGFTITGAIADATFGDLTLKQASLDVFIGAGGVKKASRRPFQIAIKGSVNFQSIDIDVSVYFAKNPKEGLLFTVYGEYNKLLSTGMLSPELQGTFLDSPMKQVALLAGNTNVPAPGFVNKYDYPLIKGVQLCAQIGSIPALNNATGVNLDGLTLRAGLAAGTGLQLAIDLPTDKAITFSPTVTSGPISVSIEIARPPSLLLQGGLNVLVSGQVEPLVFTMGLNATVTSLSGFAQLDGFWVNPFQISPKVKIGPTLALQLGLSYAPPSLQVAVTGGLMIGSTSATVSLAVGANPSQELISASLQSLSSNDLIAFASDVLQQDIPRIDEDVFNFEAVSVSISTGVQVGTVYTPPGVSFGGTINLFGEKASMEAFVREEIKISGTFEAFGLGPLAVTGAQGPNPKFEFELGPKRQSLLLDGAAKLVELQASLHVEATLLPKPAFEFDMGLAFTELLPFTLHGAMLGALDIKHVSKLDFDLSATLEQKILDYLMTQANMQFVAAEKGAKEGFETARAKLDQVEASFQNAVNGAQSQLNAAQVAWDAKQKDVKSAFDQVKQSTKAQQAGLQSRLDTAQAAYNQKIDAATKSLEQTRVSAAASIQAAQGAVKKSTIDGAASVAAHQADFDNQKKSIDAKFGDARQSVQNAQNSVQAAQNNVDDAERRLAVAQQNYNNASVFNKAKFAAQIAAIQSERGSKYAALKTAQGVLSGAQSVLNGLGYNAALSALKSYQDSLDLSVQASNAAISAANSTLAFTITAQNAAVASATTALNAARNSSAESVAFSAANKALQDFLTASTTVVAAAQSAVDNLASTTEGVAFATATNALNFAKNNTADLDIARHALDTAQAASAIALDVSKWMVNHVGNFVNITLVELKGTLRGLVDVGRPMTAHIKGMIVSNALDYTIEYSIGRTPDLIKALFEKIWGELNAKVIRLPV